MSGGWGENLVNCYGLDALVCHSKTGKRNSNIANIFIGINFEKELGVNTMRHGNRDATMHMHTRPGLSTSGLVGKVLPLLMKTVCLHILIVRR